MSDKEPVDDAVLGSLLRQYFAAQKQLEDVHNEIRLAGQQAITVGRTLSSLAPTPKLLGADLYTMLEADISDWPDKQILSQLLSKFGRAWDVYRDVFVALYNAGFPQASVRLPQ